MLSAQSHPTVIDQYLLDECRAGRVAGPFSSPPVPNLHISRFGVIPKRSAPGKWRLILDLSYPEGASVNDGIPKDQFSMQYISVDDAIRFIVELGPGALMAKIDIASAYRLIPIHPLDRFLLGMKWRDQFFVDLALPFGLRSAPYLFSQYADGLQWIAQYNYDIQRLLHYLDDFFTAGRACLSECQAALDTLISLCESLGVPLAVHKVVGPDTILEFLGILLDSIRMEARLPPDKLSRLQSLVAVWLLKKSATKRELLSLIGLLHHASKVVVPGRTFLRRMIDVSCSARELHHHIRVSKSLRLDLLWWHNFLASWNGKSFFLFPEWAPLPSFSVSSDAAGSLGYAALFKNQWFAMPWTPALMPLAITFKELFPIVVAAWVWGNTWSRLRVVFQCDNSAVVSVISSGTSRDPAVMHLLRSLLLAAATFNFTVTATHLPGKLNRVADALSRFQFQVFRQLCPEASPSPCPVHPELVSSLIPTP